MVDKESLITLMYRPILGLAFAQSSREYSETCFNGTPLRGTFQLSSIIMNDISDIGDIDLDPMRESLKHHSKDLLGYNLTRTQTDKLDTDILRNELNGTELYQKAMRLDNKLVLIHSSSDIELFQDILKYKTDNPLLGRNACMERFAEFPHSDALVKIIFGSKLDYVLRYTSTEPEPNYRNRKYLKQESFTSLRLRHFIELLSKGLFLVLEKSIFEQDDRFVQVAASFEVLCNQAEVQALRFPLSPEIILKFIPELGLLPNEKGGLISKSRAGIALDDNEYDFIGKRSIAFKFSDLAAFRGGNYRKLGYSIVKSTFLPKKTRLYLTDSIISSCTVKLQFNNTRNSSLPQLLEIGVYRSYYALHDNSLHHFKINNEHLYDDIPRGTRAHLRKWTDTSILVYARNCQTDMNSFPLDDIRAYFGEQIAFYFAWLGFYTEWFQYLAIIAVLFTFYGAYFKLVDGKPWLYIFDNELTPIFGLISSVWSTLFLKFWKRRANTLSFKWDMDSYDEIELPRVQWKPTDKHQSPVTGKEVEYVPAFQRRLIRVFGTFLMTVSFLILCGFTAGNIAFTSFLQQMNGWADFSTVIASSVFVIAQIVLIMPVYEVVAMLVNNMENYKFPTRYNDRLVLKQFAMSFVNSFGLLFFSATIKPVIFQMKNDFKYFGMKF